MQGKNTRVSRSAARAAASRNNPTDALREASLRRSSRVGGKVMVVTCLEHSQLLWIWWYAVH